MDTSILKRISEFAKENNISIKGASYKFSDIFPESFYETIINYLQKAYPEYKNDIKINNFFIGFDKNKNAYFEFIGSNEKTTVIILADNVRYDCIFPASLKIKENIFLENVKNLDLEKKKKILENLPIEFKRRFIKDDPIENFFNKLAENINLYINYLDSEKKKLYELLQKEYDEAKTVEKLYFIEADASKNNSSIHPSKIQIKSERKNDEIPLEKRIDVLHSYSPNDEFEAISSNSSSVYYVKVFKVKEKCKLVIEPKEGNKYTKIVHLDTNKLEKAEIKKIVLDALQLSRKETTEKENITRHSHTTLNEYKKLLEYLINENNIGLHYGTIKRIDEASESKKR